MRLLITGITSIHGWPLFNHFRRLLGTDSLFGIMPPKTAGLDQIGCRRICLTDAEALQRLQQTFQPTHVLHCGGVCDLDACEARPQWALEMNAMVSRKIAGIFGPAAHVTFVSTDLVFSGNAPPEGGYPETVPPDPVSVVGRTMTEAEERIAACPRHCIIRLALPLGDSFQGNKGAQDWIESRFRANRPATLFYDEYRSCIFCHELGPIFERILDRELTGLYHLGGRRPWSLYEIGRYVLARGPYAPELLMGRYRKDEQSGPPRIGDVTLNSSKLFQALDSLSTGLRD